jgi:hypothetical protein
MPEEGVAEGKWYEELTPKIENTKYMDDWLMSLWRLPEYRIWLWICYDEMQTLLLSRRGEPT